MASTSRRVQPTVLTKTAIAACVVIAAATAAILLVRYNALPDLLPVHFTRNGFPDGWQFKTIVRVLMPVFVQGALLATFGSVAMLLLSRPHGMHDVDAPDVIAASAAAEAIALIAFVWIAFQAYAGLALVSMWQHQRDGLGPIYTLIEITGVVVTVIVFARAQMKFGRPAPRPYVAEHWRLGQLYKNPADPALFVPTRDGTRWTLNFGRPVAAALMGILLAAGILGPAAILRLLLR